MEWTERETLPLFNRNKHNRIFCFTTLNVGKNHWLLEGTYQMRYRYLPICNVGNVLGTYAWAGVKFLAGFCLYLHVASFVIDFGVGTCNVNFFALGRRVNTSEPLHPKAHAWLSISWRTQQNIHTFTSDSDVVLHINSCSHDKSKIELWALVKHGLARPITVNIATPLL